MTGKNILNCTLHRADIGLPDEEKITLLCACLGNEGLCILNTLTMTETCAAMIDALTVYFSNAQEPRDCQEPQDPDDSQRIKQNSESNRTSQNFHNSDHQNVSTIFNICTNSNMHP